MKTNTKDQGRTTSMPMSEDKATSRVSHRLWGIAFAVLLGFLLLAPRAARGGEIAVVGGYGALGSPSPFAKLSLSFGKRVVFEGGESSTRAYPQVQAPATRCLGIPSQLWHRGSRFPAAVASRRLRPSMQGCCGDLGETQLVGAGEDDSAVKIEDDALTERKRELGKRRRGVTRHSRQRRRSRRRARLSVRVAESQHRKRAKKLCLLPCL